MYIRSPGKQLQWAYILRLFLVVWEIEAKKILLEKIWQFFSPRQRNFRRAVNSVYVFRKKRRQQEAFWNTAFNQFVLKLLTPNAPKIYFLYHRTIFFFWKKWEHSPSTIVVRFLFPKLALSLIFFLVGAGFSWSFFGFPPSTKTNTNSYLGC